MEALHQREKRGTLVAALFVVFIDNMGIGLIYPIFPTMLFKSTLLPPEMTEQIRGIMLGVLLGIAPLAQFFSAPLWGAFSDSKGRKGPLLTSLAVAALGYLIALGGVYAGSVFLLLLSRLVVGFASGNMAVVQAAIADLSKKEEKAKNFGLYSMALGVGFTLGPFFGGTLSSWGYSKPFLFALALVLFNLLLAAAFFKETHFLRFKRSLTWDIGLSQMKKALHLKGLRATLLASFFHNFAWSYFFETAPVYLIERFRFTSTELGLFYASAGAYYALSTGLLIRPFIKRYSPEALFFGGNLLAASSLFLLPFISTNPLIWVAMFFVTYFVAFVTPASTTIVSNRATEEMQGEALGILSAANALALGASPLLAGFFVGLYPSSSMWVGSGVMFLAALVIFLGLRKKPFTL